jgi:hypothetical protein
MMIFKWTTGAPAFALGSLELIRSLAILNRKPKTGNRELNL